jgi:hypothetical protein
MNKGIKWRKKISILQNKEEQQVQDVAREARGIRLKYFEEDARDGCDEHK